MRRIALSAIIVGLGAVGSLAEARPAFEVASVGPQREPIRAENVATGMIPRALPGCRFSVTHVTVESLLAFAYDLRPYRIIGGPEWVRTDRFAVNAKAAGIDSSLRPERLTFDDVARSRAVL